MNVDTEFHKVCHCALRKDGSSCECGAMQTQKPPNLQAQSQKIPHLTSPTGAQVRHLKSKDSSVSCQLWTCTYY